MVVCLRVGWLLLLLVALRHSGAAQPAVWRRVALDSVASLEFPDSVRHKRREGQQVLTCHAGPSLFIVVQQPGGRLMGLLGTNNADFLDGMVKGLLQESGGKLLHRSNFVVSGFTGVEVQFTTPHKAELPATRYTRMVMANGTVYSLNYMTGARQEDTLVAERTRFFSSFRLAARPETLVNSAYRFGYRAGQLFLYVLLAGGVLLGLLLLVRRLRTPPVF